MVNPFRFNINHLISNTGPLWDEDFPHQIHNKCLRFQSNVEISHTIIWNVFETLIQRKKNICQFAGFIYFDPDVRANILVSSGAILFRSGSWCYFWWFNTSKCWFWACNNKRWWEAFCQQNFRCWAAQLWGKGNHTVTIIWSYFNHWCWKSC